MEFLAPAELDIITCVFFFSALAPIVYVDIRKRRIPNLLTAAGILAIFLSRLLQHRLEVFDFIAGGLSGFAVILLLWIVAPGKIGLGDAKLSALIGAFLGIFGWFIALFAASLAGLLFLAGMMAVRKMRRTDSIAFAPFLGFGAVIGAVFSLRIWTTAGFDSVSTFIFNGWTV